MYLLNSNADQTATNTNTDNTAQMEPITGHANDPAGAYSGTSPSTARTYYDEVYNWGTASPSHYGIELTPYLDDSLLATQNIQLYGANELQSLLMRIQAQNGEYDTPSLGDSSILLSDEPLRRVLPWLAQSITASNINAQVESVQVGSQQFNYINGCVNTEVTVNFIETRNFAISNSLQAIKSIMFPRDGTQGYPANYLMKMKIYAFDRHVRAINPFELNYLVAVQSDSLNFDATNASVGMIIPVTFVTMFPSLVDNNLNEIQLE